MEAPAPRLHPAPWHKRLNRDNQPGLQRDSSDFQRICTHFPKRGILPQTPEDVHLLEMIGLHGFMNRRGQSLRNFLKVGET
jgi:hypothetical protein